MTAPTPPDQETLRHLHGANVQHIAQMKEATRSLLRWTIGVTISYLIAWRAAALDKYVPDAFIPAASFVTFCVAAYSLIFVMYTQWKMKDTRIQLHDLQEKLHLPEEYNKDKPIVIFGRKLPTPSYKSYWYGWIVWVPASLLCFVCALTALKIEWWYYLL